MLIFSKLLEWVSDSLPLHSLNATCKPLITWTFLLHFPLTHFFLFRQLPLVSYILLQCFGGCFLFFFFVSCKEAEFQSSAKPFCNIGHSHTMLFWVEIINCAAFYKFLRKGYLWNPKMQSLHHCCHDTYLACKGIVRISYCCVFLLLQHLFLSLCLLTL